MTDAQLAALEAWEGSNLFDEKTQAALRYVEAIILAGGEVDDAVFDALSKQFSPQEIVEITIIVGNYFATGILTKALKVKVDPPGAVAGKC
jgi:alkylhydroperoxidase family enzyme